MITVGLPSGRTILFPTLDAAGERIEGELGVEPGTGYTDVGFAIDFADLAETAAEIGDVLRRALATAVPSKVTAEVTVGIDARTGRVAAFFVDGTATAGVKLTLEWERPTEKLP